MIRTLLVALTALVFAAPLAALGKSSPDGYYRVKKVEGRVTLFNQRINLPIGPLRDALVRNGLVVVRHDRMPIRKHQWERVLEEFRFRGIEGEATGTAPSAIVFKKRGRGFAGRSAVPMVITQKGRYKKGWFSVSTTVTMRSNLDTKIQANGKLVMDSPISISALGLTARGSINLEAQKVEITNPFR